MTEVLTSLIYFFLWNNVGKVNRHLVQEGNIGSGKCEFNRISVRRFDALHRGCRAVHEFLGAQEARDLTAAIAKLARYFRRAAVPADATATNPANDAGAANAGMPAAASASASKTPEAVAAAA